MPSKEVPQILESFFWVRSFADVTTRAMVRLRSCSPPFVRLTASTFINSDSKTCRTESGIRRVANRRRLPRLAIDDRQGPRGRRDLNLGKQIPASIRESLVAEPGFIPRRRIRFLLVLSGSVI